MTSESSPPLSSPPSRPLNIRYLVGALALAVALLAVLVAGRSDERRLPEPDSGPAPAPVDEQAAKDEADVAALSAGFKTRLEASRSALKKGDLLEARRQQELAESEAREAVRKWPGNEKVLELPGLAADIIIQFEKYGGADPPAPGLSAGQAEPYPDDPTAPDSNRVNSLFVAGWAKERQNQAEAAIVDYNQALDLLDRLLAPGDITPAPAAAEDRHSEVSLPPQPVEGAAEALYLRKYYAASDRLAALESQAGREDRAEAARRRALAAMDRALAGGAEVSAFYEALDSLLHELALRERFSGRLESARQTCQRRLGLRQYLAANSRAGQSPPAEAGRIPVGEREQILLELGWLGRHTFHYDEGLEYLAELLDMAGRPGPAVFSEADRRALLTQAELMMDLGRFQAAETALQKALPQISRIQDDSRPVSLNGELNVEPRVTTIKTDLALAELRLAQGDPVSAEKYMEEAVSLYNTLPGGHPVTFDVQLVRVKILARKGDSARAERELTPFLAGASGLLASPEVDIWVKRQILALMAEAAWQARARGETSLAAEHYRRVNDELTPYITGIDVDNSSEYGSLFRPILVEIMEGEGDLRAAMGQMSQAESRYVLGLDMARALKVQEPRQYFWLARFESLVAKVGRFHY